MSMAAKDNITELNEGNIPRKPNTMTEFLSMVKGGTLDVEVGDALTEIIEAVKQSNRKGEIHLKFKVEPESNGEQVSITEEIVKKPPKRSRARSILYTTPDGWVSDKHPKQLGFRY